MVEMIRVNIGDNVTYLPAKDGKKQVAYVDLAENRRTKNDAGEWVDADPHWYEARFEGAWADRITGYAKGDALLVVGNTEKRVREVDGKTFRSTRLYVDGFGPDPIINKISVNGVEKVQNLSAAREAAPAADAEAEQHHSATYAREQSTHHEYGNDPARALELMYARVQELVAMNRLSPAAAEAIKSAPTGNSPTEWRDNVNAQLNQANVSGGEREYLASVTAEAAGAGRVLTWQEAEQAAGVAPAADPWEKIAEARADIAADQQTPAPAYAQ